MVSTVPAPPASGVTVTQADFELKFANLGTAPCRCEVSLRPRRLVPGWPGLAGYYILSKNLSFNKTWQPHSWYRELIVRRLYL